MGEPYQPPSGSILLVTEKSPFPPDSGSKQRSWLLVEALRSVAPVEVAVIGATGPADALGSSEGVVVHWLGEMPTGGGSTGFSRRLHDLFHPFGSSPQLTANLANLVRRGKYRAVVFRYLPVYARVRDACRGMPTVVDVDDLDTQKLRSEACNRHLAVSRRAWAALRLLFVERNIRQVARSAGALMFCTQEDAAELGLPDFEVVPNLPLSLAHEAPPPLVHSTAEPPTIKFLGRLSWDVNIRGIDGFLAESWPQIRASCPEVRFEIGGSNLHEAQRRRWEAVPGVSVVGFVDDIGAFYNRATFTICPIFEGGGTKIKVLESLWHGRAVVLTPHSLRGHEMLLPSGEGVALGSNWPELARQCVRLLSDHRARKKTEAEGYRRVVAGLAWECHAGLVRRALERAERTMTARDAL